MHNAQKLRSMKKFVLTALVCLMALPIFAQAKKPSIMFVPSTAWCRDKGYGTYQDVMGVQEFIPNYTAALQDIELLPVIAELNGLMADRGMPALHMQATMSNINRRRAEEAAMQSKSGNQAMTNDLRELRNQARADIMVYITWSTNRIGPKKSITYTLDAQDPYTGMSVATSTGTGTPSFSVETPVLLKEAVNAHMDEFTDRLQAHFDDLFANGRSVTLQIRVFENNPMGIDLETEMGDEYKELREIIEDWVYENTVSHRYNLMDDSEVHMNFVEVRMPLYDERGRAMAARDFGRQLVRYLRSEPCNIDAIKLDSPGLGEAVLYIGEK